MIKFILLYVKIQHLSFIINKKKIYKKKFLFSRLNYIKNIFWIKKCKKAIIDKNSPKPPKN